MTLNPEPFKQVEQGLSPAGKAVTASPSQAHARAVIANGVGTPSPKSRARAVISDGVGTPSDTIGGQGSWSGAEREGKMMEISKLRAQLTGVEAQVRQRDEEIRNLR